MKLILHSFTVLACSLPASARSPWLALTTQDPVVPAARPSPKSAQLATGQPFSIQVGGLHLVVSGSGSSTVTSALPPSNDNCSTPVAIAGPGPHPFDLTATTTGIQGQTEALCLAAATTGIANDEWFTWTAGATGTAQLTTCSQTSVDTKVAVYAGAGCPAASAIACNDDSCAFQSSLCFVVTSGQSYTIQLGTFPGASVGTGTFTIVVSPPLPPCRYDDGVTENLLGWLAGGEMVWMQRFGGIGDTTNVSDIEVAWGSAAFPGFSPGNGSASKVAIWSDPNNDGDPSDAVLLQIVGTTVALVDTDTFVTVPITPVVVSGVFFLGAGLSHSPGQFVAPMDTSCPIAGVAWFFGNDNATPADYATVSNNANPPATFDSAGFPAVVMVRGACAVSPGITFCEPGLGGVIPCPCGNPPSGPGRGCDNSSATGGAALTDTGTASLTADTVVLTTTWEKPTALSIVLQGNAPLVAGLPYGDGVRCTGGSLKRLYVKSASGGSITAPAGGDPLVHVRSATLGDPISSGTTRYYQVYYRDPVFFACPLPGGATFNTSSGRTILWNP